MGICLSTGYLVDRQKFNQKRSELLWYSFTCPEGIEGWIGEEEEEEEEVW